MRMTIWWFYECAFLVLVYCENVRSHLSVVTEPPTGYKNDLEVIILWGDFQCLWLTDWRIWDLLRLSWPWNHILEVILFTSSLLYMYNLLIEAEYEGGWSTLQWDHLNIWFCFLSPCFSLRVPSFSVMHASMPQAHWHVCAHAPFYCEGGKVQLTPLAHETARHHL